MSEDFERACKHDDAETVHKMLMQQPKVPIEIRNGKSETGLLIASSNGALKVCRLLIFDHNCNINAQNNHGDTAILSAAKKGHFEIVKYLVESGALWFYT
jgi:ankyrin repeat protein